ncbi:hypothetical protein SAMN03080615_01679 [Amphritea atlantica]|uniref:Uncharacterized protein n=1 Tax=Amphritea atlantica TaxID=355243 RepID=A0A1H9GH80_9GAMM|nr:hypothetical protein [Amphritea atlantica]SEQ49445.1 hypothetical protein SAMN03080615_01679 [Amphritea atlantica]
MNVMNLPMQTRPGGRVMNMPLGGFRKRALSRYFTAAEAAYNHYFTIPELTVDRVVMDVYSPAGDAAGLPAGAPTPTASKYVTLDFAYSGTISELLKNGADYFTGIPANIYLYNSGSVLAYYKADEDFSQTSVLIDHSGNGNHGAAVNIVLSYLNTFAGNGWLGSNEALISETGLLGDDASPELSNPVFVTTAGYAYRISARIAEMTGASSVGWSTLGGIPGVSPFREFGPAVGDAIGGTFIPTASGVNCFLFGRAEAITKYNSITAQKFLEIV